jgi:hypothetical protein
MPKGTPYSNKLHGILKGAYGDDFVLSEDQFFEKITNDPGYQDKIYGIFKDVYKDQFVLTPRQFYDKLKKKEATTENLQIPSQLGGKAFTTSTEEVDPATQTEPPKKKQPVKRDSNASRYDLSYKPEPLQTDVISAQVPTPIQKAVTTGGKTSVAASNPRTVDEKAFAATVGKVTADPAQKDLFNYDMYADEYDRLEKVNGASEKEVISKIQKYDPELWKELSQGITDNMVGNGGLGENLSIDDFRTASNGVYQRYLALLEENKKKLSESNAKSNKAIDEIVKEKINEKTFEQYVKPDVNYKNTEAVVIDGRSVSAPKAVASGKKVIDVDKINDLATEIVESYNLSDDGKAWQLVFNKLKSQADYEIDRGRGLEILGEKYPESAKNLERIKTESAKIAGMTPEQFNEYWTDDDAIVARYESLAKSAKDQALKEAEMEASVFINDYTYRHKEIESEYKSVQEKLSSEADMFDKAYELNQIDEPTYKQAIFNINAQLDKAFTKYQEDYQGLDQYVKSANEVYSRYNKKLNMQLESIQEKADSEITGAFNKYVAMFEDPAVLSKIQDDYSKAHQEAALERAEAMGDAAYENSAITYFLRSTKQALGGVISGYGGYFDSKLLKVLGETVAQNNKLEQAKTENFSDLLSGRNLLNLSGQLGGSMLPGMGATAIVATATAGQGIPAVIPMITGGFTGWLTESMDIAGRAYNDMFEKTNGDVQKASAAYREAFNSQYDLMGTYAFSALPFVGGALSKISRTVSKGVTKVAGSGAGKLATKITDTKAGRMTVGGVLEYGEEYVQEFNQGIAEENISEGRDAWSGWSQKIKDPKRHKENAITLAPTLIMGALGQARSKSPGQQAADAFMAIDQKTKINPAFKDQQRQYIQNVVFERNADFAKSMISTLFSAGNIDEKKASDMIIEVERAQRIKESADNANLKGDNRIVYSFFASRAEEAERNARIFHRDPIMSKVFEQQAKDYQQAGVEFINGKTPELYSITFADGSQNLMTQSDIADIMQSEDALSVISEGNIQISSYGSKTGANSLETLREKVAQYEENKKVTEEKKLYGESYNNTIDVLNAIKNNEEYKEKINNHPSWSTLTVEEQDEVMLLTERLSKLEREKTATDAVGVESVSLDEKIKIAKQDLSNLLNREPNDNKNVPGVSSEIGEGKKPVEEKPVEVTGTETPEAGGVLQAQEEVDSKKVAVEKAQKQLDGLNSERNPKANHPLFNVGQKYDYRNKLLVINSDDRRTDTTKDGVEVITKIISPAEVDENGIMTKAAEVEIGIFDSYEQGQEYVNSQYNKYKAVAEEKLAKANAELSTSEAQPTTEAAPVSDAEKAKQEEISKETQLLNVEDVRRPNGSIGTQGFDPSQMKDLVKFMSDELGLNIPENLLDKKSASLKPLIDYIIENEDVKNKIIDYVKSNPSEISIMPDGSVQFLDGNHRANLLNIIGSDVIPVIEQKKADEIRAKYEKPAAETTTTEAAPEVTEDRSMRGVKFSDIFVGDALLTDLMSGLNEADQKAVKEIFTRGVDYFKFNDEESAKFAEGFANPEDISDVLDTLLSTDVARQSAYDYYNTKNYENVKDAIRYILENKQDYSPELVGVVETINEKLTNPESSSKRLYAIDFGKELGITSAPEPVTEKPTKPKGKKKTEPKAEKPKRQQVEESLKKLRDQGLLVTADTSLLAKAKKLVGKKSKPVPMSDKEIAAQMKLLDAMAKVWKNVSGEDTFYDEFINEVKKGDLKKLQELGGVLYQEEGDEKLAMPFKARVTLGIFNLPQFKLMEGKMVAAQNVKDMVKTKAKPRGEKPILEMVLDSPKYKDQKKFSFDEFKNDVELAVMNFEKHYTSSYANYGMDNLGSKDIYGTANTIVFNAPVSHGYSGHWDNIYDPVEFSKRDWVLREVPEQPGLYVAWDNNAPGGIGQDQLMNYVGTAGTRDNVENWIKDIKNIGTDRSKVKIGLFGHIRTWQEGDKFYVAEMQSDTHQKYEKNNKKPLQEGLLLDLGRENVVSYIKDTFYPAFMNVMYETYSFGSVSDVISGMLNDMNVRINGNLFYEIGVPRNDGGFDYIPLASLEKMVQLAEDSKKAFFEYASNNALDRDYAGIDRYGPIRDMIHQSVMSMLLRSSSDFISPGEEYQGRILKNGAFVLMRFKSLDNAFGIEYQDYFDEVVIEFVDSDQYKNFQKQYSEIYTAYDSINIAIETAVKQTKADTNLTKHKEQLSQEKIKAMRAVGGFNYEKQFLDLDKNYMTRLVRESIRLAAESGAKTMLIPSPLTIAKIEGYSTPSASNGQTDRAIPYETPNGTDDDLSVGDIIKIQDEEYRVVEANATNITVVLDKDVFVQDFYEEASEMAWNDVSEVQYSFRRALERAGRTFNSKRITQEDIDAVEGEDFDYYSDLHGLMQREIDKTPRSFDLLDDNGEAVEENVPYITWDDITGDMAQDLTDSNASMDAESLFGRPAYEVGNSGDYYVTDYDAETLEFRQPDQYDEKPIAIGEDGQTDIEKSFEESFRADLPAEQATVVQKYINLRDDFKKLRPDAKPFIDENRNVWYETQITPEDLDNPIIAFQKEGEKAKAAIDFTIDQKATVHIFKGADISSLAHEMTGHIGRRLLERLAAQNADFAKDYEAAKKWSGVKGDFWNTAAEEKFARGFERYLRSGKAPNKSLQSVFNKLREWFSNIYEQIKGGSIDVNITPRMKKVFDNLLAYKPEPKPEPKTKAETKAEEVKPKPKQEILDKAKRLADLYREIKSGNVSVRPELDDLLDKNPKLKYLYKNLPNINAKLEKDGLITKKTDGCP